MLLQTSPLTRSDFAAADHIIEIFYTSLISQRLVPSLNC